MFKIKMNDVHYVIHVDNIDAEIDEIENEFCEPIAVVTIKDHHSLMTFEKSLQWLIGKYAVSTAPDQNKGKQYEDVNILVKYKNHTQYPFITYTRKPEDDLFSAVASTLLAGWVINNHGNGFMISQSIDGEAKTIMGHSPHHDYGNLQHGVQSTINRGDHDSALLDWMHSEFYKSELRIAPTMMGQCGMRDELCKYIRANSAEMATSNGRGMTASIQYFDEFDFLPYNNTTSQNAKANGNVAEN